MEVVDPAHPLLKGLASFETVDELYVCAMSGDVTVLMDTAFDGECPGFEEGSRPDALRHPVLWQRAERLGTVTYLTLGHCRRRYDVADRGIEDTELDRRAWAAPGFQALLDRTIAWAVHGADWPACTSKLIAVPTGGKP